MEELWKGHLQYIQLLPFTAYIQAWKPPSHAKGYKHKLRRMGVPELWFGIGQKLILPMLWGGRIRASSHLEIAWTHLHSRMAPCLNYHVPLRHIHSTQKVKHFVALFLWLKYYSQAVQPYEISSPGNTLKKRGWKYYQNVSCLPPPLHRKVSIYFINNTDFSVRHQITPAMTGPVHRIPKLFLLAFTSQHRRIFQSREYTLELWFHAIGEYGDQRENLWGKDLQSFQKKAIPGRMFARIMLPFSKH